MVIAVGCNIKRGYLKLYNSLTKKTEDLQLNPFNRRNLNFIEEFFKEIHIKIDGIIDCLCVLMDYEYENVFRKNFIEYAKTQSNIKNVQIVSIEVLKLCCAIKNLSFSSEMGNLICTFSCHKEMVFCNIWVFSEGNQWKLETRCEVEKTFTDISKSPTVEDLQILKSKLQQFFENPYIFVLSYCAVNENYFKVVFSKYKIYEFDEGALNFARSFLNENEYLKFKIKMNLGRILQIKIRDKILLHIPEETILPFTKTINVINNKVKILNIYESEIETEKTLIGKGNISITLSIDINGIYSIEIIKTDKTNEQNGLYLIPKKIQNYNSELNAIGIDFGTTECCASVIRNNGPDCVVLGGTGERTMPSYISFDEKMPKCGQIVVDRMRNNAKYSVYDTKRIIGKNLESILIDPLWPFTIRKVQNSVVFEIETLNGKDTKSPEKLSSILLKYIKSKLEAYQNTILTETVITIPSVFSEKQKEATKFAATIAGFETIYFLPEPVAAAFAYFTEIEIPNQSYILICDCGGGTFDICIAKIENDQLQILNFDGDSYLGGRDFDKILFNHFNAILKHKFNFDVMESSKKYVLKKKCQEIKHDLSAFDNDLLDVHDFDPNIDKVIEISREEFEEMSSNFIIQMKDVILQILKRSNLSKDEINYVFQVGGGCRMPIIKEMLKEIFPNSNHHCSAHPEEIVAHGAALYAYQLKSGKEVLNEQKEKPRPSLKPDPIQVPLQSTETQFNALKLNPIQSIKYQSYPIQEKYLG